MTSTGLDGSTNGHSSAAPEPNSLHRLDGKVALVTGSGRGLGAGIAIDLGSRGASIIVNYAKSSSAANSVVEEIRSLGSEAIAIQADISKTPQVSRLFEEGIAHFGRLDIVVSNSGMETFCKETDVTEALYDQVFGLNTRGQFFVAQHALKHLSHYGRIILTSSVAATMSGIGDHALYAGSKAAVEAFTRSFSVDAGEKKITVNAIAPGGVKTDMYTENSWHYVPGGYPGMPMETIDQGLANFSPLKRVAVPRDISRVVAFLAGPESEWVNGEFSFLIIPLVLSSLRVWKRDRHGSVCADSHSFPRPSLASYRWIYHLDIWQGLPKYGARYMEIASSPNWK